MLVKFISFVITVFGTKRYKPLLLTFAALIVSLTGISAVAAFSTGMATPAASTTTAEEHEANTKEILTPQTPRKQSPRGDTTNPQDQAAQPGQGTPSSANAASTSVASSNQSQNDQTAPTILLSTIKLTVAKNASNDQLTASVSDNSQVEWSVALPENTPAELQVIADTSTAASNARFTVKTTAATPAGTYNVTIQAKDTAKSVTYTKILTITVTE